jgi:hypothetical protein
MANQSLLTNWSRSALSQLSYYSPVAQVNGNFVMTMYSFLARVAPWDDDNNPPVPKQDLKSLKALMRDIFVVKKISASEISPIIQRNDWVSGTVYNYFQDDIDMFEKDVNGRLVKTFYVKNRYDQVFKCLSNNFIGGVSTTSTVEPYFEPGAYSANKIYTGLDGYKWKYIYTIDVAAKIKFMDSSWLPVSVGTAPNPFRFPSIGFGNIEVINVLDGGFGYDQANAIINIVVSGDGTGCTATANVKNGSIDFISVASSGKNYTFANVAITSAQGSGAIAVSPVSPVGGHGSDPISELGCSRIMITSTYTGSETDSSGVKMIPTDIDYHQVGLIINPTALSTTPYNANKNIYKTTTDLVVAGGFGEFVPDELVYVGASVQDAYINGFVGRVVSFDPSANIIKLVNCVGTLLVNVPVFGETSQTVRTILATSLPDYEPVSGNVIYVENRSSIQRSEDGIEQIKVVFGF